MQSIVSVNPLKPGKLEAYKAFSAENLGPRKEEYLGLLKHYGLKTVRVYYHKLGNQEFIIVYHDAEDDALKRLESFANSENPYDQWFFEQLLALHDFEKSGENTQAELLFSLEV